MQLGTAWVKLFVGQPGNGKGYNVCLQIAEVLGGGGHVSGNVDIVKEGMVKLVQKRYGRTPDLEKQYHYLATEAEIHNFHRNTPSGTPDCPTLVVIDEADLYWDAKNHAAAARDEAEMFAFLKTCRHEATMVILITQSPENLNARMRRLAEIWDFRDMSRLTFLGWKPWKHWFVAIQRPPKGRGSLKKTWVPRDQAVFGAYKSSQFQGLTKRAGTAERVELEKTGRMGGWRSWVSRWWRRLLLIGGVCLLVYRCNAPAPDYGRHAALAKPYQPTPARVVSSSPYAARNDPASPAPPAPPPAKTFSGPDGQEYTFPPENVVVVRNYGKRLRVRQITLAAPPYPRPEVLQLGDWSSVLNMQIAGFGSVDGQPVIINEHGTSLRIVVGKSHFGPGVGLGSGVSVGPVPPAGTPPDPGNQ